MIIRLLKESHPIGYLLSLVLLVVVGAVWGNGKVMMNPSGDLFLYDMLASAVAHLPNGIISTIVVLLIGYQAYHWNKVVSDHEVLYKKSLLPMMFLVVFALLQPAVLTFNPVLPVITLTIIILDKLFQVYKNQKPLGLIFDCGFLAGVSGLFWFPSIALTPFVMISLVILKPISFRDVLVLVIGVLTPLFLAFACLFVTDQFTNLAMIFPIEQLDFSPDLRWTIQNGDWGFLIVFITMLLMASWRINRNFYKNATRVRMYQQTIFTLLFFSMLGFVFSNDHADHAYYFMALPFSSMVSYYFLAGKKAWWEEFVFLIIIMVAVGGAAGII